MSLTALILAAGQGTRMKSTTPKVLHRVLGRTMVGHVVMAARAAGADSIVVVVGHARQLVEETLRADVGGDDLTFAVQAEQRGTGHAVLQGRSASPADGQVLVLAGDVPNLSPSTLKQFVGQARDSGKSVAVMTTTVEDATGYGRIVRDAQGRVIRCVEHRDANDAQRAIREINVGTFVFDAAFLWEQLPKLGDDNANGEFYLPDLIEVASRDDQAVALEIDDPQECAGVNTRVQLAEAEARARRLRNIALMLGGVTLLDPATTRVEAGVVVGPDTVLEASVSLLGSTTLASGVTVRQGAIIENSTLETGVTIKPYSHLEDSVVREGAQVGPFAHLRPLSDVGPGARVGNFVEIKKSTLAAGVKAGHLSYLGDATIGAGTNIGAGTITCNYDGVNKHPTVLGEGVFIGSNTALVAPVSVGDKGYIGAGSTITNDVASGDLSVARGRQRNIEGWVEKHGPKK